MADLNEIDETIARVAAEPASAQGDGQSATNQPLDKLIEYRKFAAANQPQTGSCRKPRGIKLVRCIPPGAS